MGKGEPKASQRRKAVSTRRAKPRSLAIAAEGVSTGHDFANLMSALMCDLIDDRIEPKVSNAVCNAGGKLLRIVELQMRHGTADESTARKTLTLTAS